MNMCGNKDASNGVVERRPLFQIATPPMLVASMMMAHVAMAQDTSIRSEENTDSTSQIQHQPASSWPLQIGSPGPVPPSAGAPIPEPVPGGRKAPARMPQALRWTEDWSGLKHATDRRPLEALRYIPLGDQAYLSVGGEIRYYYNYWQHLRLGASPDDRLEQLQQRLRLNANLQVNQDLRVFVELGDDREFFARAATAPNRDKLDVRQAFFDVNFPLGNGLSLTVRPGRFEMPLGNGKLVGMRDGTNVRFIYQGMRATLIEQGRFKLDGFMVKPVTYESGAFDDSAQTGTHFNGLYGSALLSTTFSLDAYYYDVARPLARYRDGEGKEERRSFGERLAIRAGGVDFDGEVTFQDGSVGDQKIQAWALMFEGGYTWAGSRFFPRLGARLNAFSGDGKPGDGKIGTFAPPFPRLPLFSDASWLNFSNLVDFYPTITFKPGSKLTVTTGPEFFWRQRRNDAVYFGPSSAPLLMPTDGKRFVGTNWNLQADYVATRNLSFRLFATKFDASGSFKSGGGKSSNYFGYWAVFRF